MGKELPSPQNHPWTAQYIARLHFLGVSGKCRCWSETHCWVTLSNRQIPTTPFSTSVAINSVSSSGGMQAQEIVLVFCQPHLWLTLPTVGLKTQAHGSVGLQAKYIIKYFNIGVTKCGVELVWWFIPEIGKFYTFLSKNGVVAVIFVLSLVPGTRLWV